MRYLGVLLAAALAAGPLAVRADDAASLLAKHKAFVGWQAGDGTLQSLVYDGQVVHQTNAGESMYAKVHVLRKGLIMREDDVYSTGMTGSNGFTGQVFWESNANGFTHPVVGDAEKGAIADELVFNEGLTGLPGTIGKTETVDGVSCTDVQVSMSATYPIDVCIDPQTGAAKRAVVDPGGAHEESIDVLAYSQVAPGKKIISKWRHTGSKYTYVQTKTVANQPLADSEFHPPAQTAVWTFANGQPFPIEFKDGDNLKGVFVNATINGVKGRFLLDTGSYDIALNRSFAGRVHMKPIESSAAVGIGGETKTETGRVDTFQVGGNVLSNVIVSSMSYDLWDGKDSDGGEIDGLVGYDLFGGAMVNLDLDSKQMTLFDPSKGNLGNGGGGVVLSVDLESQTPTIPMKVNGNILINATLDSGDLFNVTVSNDLATKYGLSMLVDTSIGGVLKAIRYASGVGGLDREECGRLDSIAVGPIVYQNAPACKSSSFEGRDAVVGFDFIKNFNILFDYPEGKMMLLPRAQNN